MLNNGSSKGAQKSNGLSAGLGMRQAVQSSTTIPSSASRHFSISSSASELAIGRANYIGSNPFAGLKAGTFRRSISLTPHPTE